MSSEMEPLFLCQAMEERDREKNGRSTGRRLETTRQQQKRPLYGRSNEIAALQECWNHLVDTATPSQPDKNDGLMEKDKSSISRRRPRSNMHVLIVRGPFGVGKRALVQSTFQTPNLPAGATVPTGSGEQEDGDGGQFGAHVYLCGRVRPTAPKSDAAEITAGTVGNQSNQERGHQLSCPQCPKRNSLQAIFEMLEQLASSTVVDTATRKKIREHLVARSDLERNPLAQSLLTLLADSCEGERRPVEFNADSTNSSDQLLSGVMNPSFISRHGACLPYPTTHPKLSGTTKTIAQLVQLIRIIASCVPLVLHMEQFQYADAESVAFFDLLLDQSDPNSGKAKPACKGLLVVLSYEDEDVGDSDDCDDSADSEEPIESFFSRLEQRDRDDVTTIRLTNLTYYDVEQWTLDELQLQATTLSDDGQAMAKYLFESTRGNPQLLRYIWQYISLELTRNGQGEASIVLSWENAPFWNEIRRNVDNWLRCGTGTVCSSTELYLQIVRRQSSAIQKFIETMALIVECGVEDSVDPSILEMVLRIPCAEAIAMACDQGLLEVTLTGRIRFPRPELQAAAASRLVAHGNRASRHLRIGRRIWKQSGLDSCDDTLDDASALLYVVARSLQLGISHVNDINELDVIAVILFRSGKKAMRSSEFAAAASYFEFALVVLGDRQWSAQCYEITLALYNGTGEAYYCTAEYDKMEEALGAIFERAKSFQDKMVAHTTLVYTNCARNRVDEAVITALIVLRGLGEAVPENPSDMNIALEYAKTRWILRRKSDRDFLGLPKASNEAKIAAMQMLNFMTLYAYPVKPNLGVLAILRIVQLAAKYGIAGPAIQAFGAYGCVLSVRRGRHHEGVRFGKIALALLEHQRDVVAWLPRTYFYTHGMTFRWRFPIRENLPPLQEAHQTALRTGDLESATFTAHVAVGLSFHAGTPLEQLEHEIRSYCHIMEPLGQVFALLSLVPRWSFVCNLIGDSKPPLDLNGDIQDAESALKRAVTENRKTSLGLYYLYCGFYSCLNGAYLDAGAMIEKSMTFLVDSDVWIVFYKGLSALSAAWDDTRTARSRHFSIGRKAIRQTKKCASVCPANFRNKYTLLKAEWAAHHGATSKALSYYDKSILLANQAGFTQEEALAYERAAHYHCHLGNKALTRSLLEGARRAYERWGAQSLVRRMEAELQKST